ncbi:BOLA class I histocompatibility antigen, alpha chain BL3-7 [Misgurnus anguillicaudatus]|uniref:BOLA class I histocompatibility antigen, alpha chain BL3-7 n=1 Tax=Misgurnus anguillicaudatus TaxID=75329 RepID=UPI003CCF45E6
MRSVVLLLLGVHLSYAGRHSLQYFYTGVSGDINFPEFTAVGLVDEGQFMYFDSNIMKAVPKTEWMRQNEGADYWDSQTQIASGNHPVFINNIQVVKERFNQSTGVHTFQFMVGCELVDDVTTGGYWQYGYDGEDLLSFDKNTLTNIAANPQAVTTKNKWDADRAQSENRKAYLENICIEWLRKYVSYGKNTLERKAAPEVSLLQKDSSSPVICHATGFYPSNIMMTWKKNQDDHNEDVEVISTLPNADGSFQKSISLSVKPEEWKNNPDIYRCVVQHVGGEKVVLLNEKNIKSNSASNNIIAIVVGCLVALAALALIIGLIVWWKKSNGYGKASTNDSDSENSGQPLPKA